MTPNDQKILERLSKDERFFEFVIPLIVQKFDKDIYFTMLKAKQKFKKKYNFEITFEALLKETISFFAHENKIN